jgi:hypothetical protein
VRLLLVKKSTACIYGIGKANVKASNNEMGHLKQALPNFEAN